MIDESNLEQVIEKLTREFVDSSDDRIDSAELLIDRMLREDGDRGENFAELLRAIHNLKGTAGNFGFPSVALIMHRLEDFIEATRRLGNDDLAKISSFFDQARLVFKTGENPSNEDMSVVFDGLPSSAVGVVSEQKIHRVSVLIVMPKGVQRKIVGAELSSCGFDLSFADNSIEAIDVALSIKPNVIVSAMELERMSGVTLARVFKAIDATSDVPFVLTTSRKDSVGLLAELPDGSVVVEKGADFAPQLSEALLELGLF